MQELQPFQYIVACQHWHDTTLACGPGVLIPRPETSRIIELADAFMSNVPEAAHKPWVDLGCGSGVWPPADTAHSRSALDMICGLERGRAMTECLSLSLSLCARQLKKANPARHVCPGALSCGVARLLEGRSAAAKVIAADISAAALSYTALNAERLGVAAIVETRQSSWCQALGDVAGTCGGVVSNPPYIPSPKLAGLQPEVSRCRSHGLLADM
jgi:release factor glutamine methyltransferase